MAQITSLATTAGLHLLEVCAETFDGTKYAGRADGVTHTSLVILHADGEGSPIGADCSFVPLDQIVALAANLEGTTLLAFAE